ncbi:uncharacterized protein LOC135823216 [Sycon ciliatum]|uniref:uncharacterized protein LOC135823216 n=1 Tax=Sycon ciliatum TaxID=27933 RepID=UPI0020ACBD49|eukprot:scpid55737/ scgid6934/ 28S ribosomal protein S12, mitochondrial; MT-RPS12
MMLRTVVQRCASVVPPNRTYALCSAAAPVSSLPARAPASQPLVVSNTVNIQHRFMTINQKLKFKDPLKQPKMRDEDKKKPQYKGVVIKPLIINPKKPNSGNRKAVRVRLPAINKEVIAYIPGIGHSLAEHQIVLVQHGKVPDCPGIRFICIRGKHDLKHVEKKK